MASVGARREVVGAAAGGPARCAPTFRAGAAITESTRLLAAATFAARQHRGQRRKGSLADPYINHPLQVAELIARVGGHTELQTLMAAILHDTVEDTDTELEDIEREFGAEIAALVAEVTDDKSIPKSERKRLQVEHAPHLTPRAKVIKLADKLCNVTDIGADPPTWWEPERMLGYFDWADAVVAGLRGVNPALEALYDERVAASRAAVQARVEEDAGKKKGKKRK
ncbi:MAG: HD domain-containing protein [Gemmatimonadaceae bacterium]|nr:HD domain-containing protein [Gemmatimonadaceae bacterium]